MKETKIFERRYCYEFDAEVKHDMNVLIELKNEIRQPQILDYKGIEIHNIANDNAICYGCIQWIYDQNAEKFNTKYRCDCLLKCAKEDEEWTEWRNKELNGIHYRKITFLPEIQDLVCKEIDKYLQDLEKIYKALVLEREEQEKEKREWEITKTFKHISPTGGETGTDGYIDAEYKSQNGEIVRMVIRDIFDVGVFFYPRRLEGNNSYDLWTESEKKLGKWLSKYGKYQIRM